MQIIKIFTTFILSLFLLISPVLAEVTTKGIELYRCSLTTQQILKQKKPKTKL